jgi:hypothetical protein
MTSWPRPATAAAPLYSHACGGDVPSGCAGLGDPYGVPWTLSGSGHTCLQYRCHTEPLTIGSKGLPNRQLSHPF